MTGFFGTKHLLVWLLLSRQSFIHLWEPLFLICCEKFCWCLCLLLCLYLPIFLSVCRSVYLSGCLTVFMPVCLFVCLSVCLTICLSTLCPSQWLPPDAASLPLPHPPWRKMFARPRLSVLPKFNSHVVHPASCHFDKFCSGYVSLNKRINENATVFSVWKVRLSKNFTDEYKSKPACLKIELIIGAAW